MENNSKLINVLWTGPFSLDEILKENVINGKGLYQIYGTHLIYGRNVLLYIGQTEVSFLERFQKHKSEWIKFEFDNVQIYSGEIIKSNDLNEDLKNAEKLLLYFCAPAYNSNSIFDLKISQDKKIVLRNFGKIGSIPIELSSEWFHSDFWNKHF